MPLPLGTPGAGQPTTGVTVGDAVGGNAGIGFGLHEPPKMRKAMSASKDGTRTPVGESPPDISTDGSSSAAGTFISTSTSTMSSSKLSEGSATTTTSTSSTNTAHAPRGTLSVKLISARGLAVSPNPDVQPQPYVVMQFEQNEFVSRPPRPVSSPASVPFTTAQAQPMTPGNLTRSTSGLGVGTITRAFAEAVGRGKGKKDGNGGAGGGASQTQSEEVEGGSWLGKAGPGDPVWKEEVSLYVGRSVPEVSADTTN